MLNTSSTTLNVKFARIYLKKKNKHLKKCFLKILFYLKLVNRSGFVKDDTIKINHIAKVKEQNVQERITQLSYWFCFVTDLHLAVCQPLGFQDPGI